MWHLKGRPMYRCFRAKLPLPDTYVIKYPTHTSPWTDGDTAAAVYVCRLCPAVVVSLLINDHLGRAPQLAAVHGTVYQTGH